MGLFSEAVEIQLNASERAVVFRSIEGMGGHQQFLSEIIERVDPAGGLVLEDDELQKVARYAYRYGSGGYQDRFKSILAAARRAGWSQS